jgi:hypothetical protein
VVREIAEFEGDPNALAAATLRASEAQLRALKDDATLAHSTWLLAQLAEAARSPDFAGRLRELGVDTDGVTNGLGLVARVGSHAREYAATAPGSNVFGDIAVEALQATLARVIGAQGAGLFGASMNDAQAALRPYGTERGFGELGQQYFGEFLGRTLTAFVDREAANVLPAGRPATVDSTRAVTDAVGLHARETARIVRDFAGQWFSKHNWLSSGSIGEAEAARFVGVALRKLRSEIAREALT